MFAVYAVQIEDIFSPAQSLPTFGVLVSSLIANLYVLAGVSAFILLIFGGVTIILGAGNSDPKRLERGRKTITTAIIGLIIVITAVWIVQIFEIITGIQLLNPTFL